MSTGRDWDNSRAPPPRYKGKDGLYDNATMNMVDPGNRNSIEDNEMQPSNTRPDAQPKLQENNRWRRAKSLTNYSKDIYHINRQIREKLARQDEIGQRIVHNDSDVQSSETELKRTPSAAHNGTAQAQSENEIYSTRLQEGNNNLMFVCESKTAQKACCKQIGDNNVMVNLHMSMVSNSCQILGKDGSVIQLDADGELWLEVKVRRNKAGEPATQSDQMNDLNKGTESRGHNLVSKDLLSHTRVPVENLDLSSSTGSSIDSSTFCRQSATENEWLSDSSSDMDRYRSLKDMDDQSEGEDVRVYEKEDAILVQVATSNDGMRLSDYSNLAECAPVQDALRHRKVMDFLKRSNKFDFDVDVTNWEYEREPVYSIPEDFPRTPDCDEDQYSYVVPVSTGKTCKIQKRPTIPPRPHNPGSPVVTNISDVLIVTGDQATDEGPILPPRRYKQSCENTDQSSPSLKLSLDKLPEKLAELDTRSSEDLKSPIASCKSPINGLPQPPPFQKRPPQPSPRLARKKIQSISDCTWYHGDINNEKSKSLLIGKPTGSFLVRDSSDSSGSHKYTLEFVADGSVRRLKIIKMDDRYHLKESETTFDTAVQLVEEAIKTGLEIKDSRRSSDWRMIKIIPVEKARENSGSNLFVL